MDSERIACVLLEEFSLEMFYQKEPSPAEQPLALTEEDRKSALIVAINQAATEHGVLINSTVPQAHTVCPDLIVKVRNTEKETSESQKLLKALQTIGPFAEKGADSTGGALTIFMEVNGLMRLHKSETVITKKIIALVESLGYPAKVGVADNKFIAKIAAETSKDNRFTIVSKGAGSAFIESLDIEHLALSSDTLETLRDLDLKTIGRLAEFPANEIAQRFGAEGATLSHLSRGRDPQQLLRVHPKEDMSNEMHLTYRIYNTATIIHHVQQLLQPLLTCLGQQGYACSRVMLKLSLENHTEKKLTLSVEKPTLSIRKLSRQLRSQLERLKLPAAVTDLIVIIPRKTITPLPSRQLNFDHHRQVGSMDNNITLKDHKLYTVSLNPTLLPEQNFHLSPLDTRRRIKGTNMHDTGTLFSDRFSRPATVAYYYHNIGGLRLFPLPIETNITTVNGTPVSIEHHRGDRQQIDRRYGPWELSGGWWHGGFDRLYYELHTADNRRYLFFFDRLRSRWFLHGIFD